MLYLVMTMTDIPTTLDPDELAEAIALTPGETMTLVRAFHPELPPGNTRRAPSRDRPGCFGFDTLWCGIWGPSHNRRAPLGKPGDVLSYWDRETAEVDYSPGWDYTGNDEEIRLAVLSVDVKLADGTWVAEAAVRKET